MIKFGADYSKLKKNLKLACARLKLLRAKRSEQNERMKSEIADYLKKGKYLLAKIKAQKVINDKVSIEAMELIGLYCEELLEKYELFEKRKEIDITLKRPISSLIYSAPYYQTFVPELQVIAKQLAIKYGARYNKMALENDEATVDPELIKRVIISIPSDEAIEKCLKKISLKYGITYVKSEECIKDESTDIKNFECENSTESSQEEDHDNVSKKTEVSADPIHERFDKFPRSFKDMFRRRKPKRSSQNSNEANKQLSNENGIINDNVSASLTSEAGEHQQVHRENSSLPSEENINNLTPTALPSQTYICPPEKITEHRPMYNEPPPSYNSIYFCYNDLKSVTDLHQPSDEIIDSIQLPSCPSEDPDHNSSEDIITLKPSPSEKHNFWNY